MPLDILVVFFDGLVSASFVVVDNALQGLVFFLLVVLAATILDLRLGEIRTAKKDETRKRDNGTDPVLSMNLGRANTQHNVETQHRHTYSYTDIHTDLKQRHSVVGQETRAGRTCR